MRPLSGSANWLKSMDMAPGADMHVERPAKMLTLSPDHYSHSTVGRTYAISRRTLATDITLTVLASLRVGPLRGRLGFAGERQLLADCASSLAASQWLLTGEDPTFGAWDLRPARDPKQSNELREPDVHEVRGAAKSQRKPGLLERGPSAPHSTQAAIG